MSSSSNPRQPAADELELVELGALSRRTWIELTQRDPAAFGRSTAGLIYRDKDLHLACRLPDGTIVAALGLTVATVEVEDLKDVVAALRAMGHVVTVPGEDNDGRRSSDAWGNMNTVLWDLRDNTLGGGSDPRNPVGKADVLLQP